MKTYTTIIVVLLILLTASGCGQRRAKKQPNTGQQDTPSPFQQSEPDYELAIVIDLSGSFEEYWLSENARAYKLVLRIIDRFFRDRIGQGHNDRLLIAQISGEEKVPILFEGTPRSFRRQFNPKSFREYLKKKCNPNGSRVHSSIADTLDYLILNRPQLGTKTRSATCIFSDMEENWPLPDVSEQRLVQSMTEYRKKGGWLGFAYVRQDLCPKWVANMKKAGYTNVTCKAFVDDEWVPDFGE